MFHLTLDGVSITTYGFNNSIAAKAYLHEVVIAGNNSTFDYTKDIAAVAMVTRGIDKTFDEL